MKGKEGARRIVSVVMAVALAAMGLTAAAWWAPQWAQAGETDPNQMEVDDVLADEGAAADESTTPEGENGVETLATGELPLEGGEIVTSSDSTAAEDEDAAEGEGVTGSTESTESTEGAASEVEQTYLICFDYGNTYGGVADVYFEAELGATLAENLNLVKAQYEEEGVYTPLFSGDIGIFGDQYLSRHTLLGWSGSISFDKVLAPSDFTPADNGQNVAVLTLNADWVDVPEPRDTDGSLLPYTVNNGVMTFDNHPELGEWYQLTVVANDGITVGTVGGSSPWISAIGTSSLDQDDPLFNEQPDSGIYFVRGDNHGVPFSLWADYDSSRVLSCELASGTGDIGRVGGPNSLAISLSSPAVLTVGYAASDVTVISNKQGATLSHVPNGTEGDAWFWSTLELVTDPISGEAANKATAALKDAVAVTGDVLLYDIHLLDPVGNVFAIPDGEQVTVTLPIPESMSLEGLRVFHVADDGTVTDMNGTVDTEARTVSFTTTHFSTFALANVAVDEAAGEVQPLNSADKQPSTLADTGDVAGVAAAGAALCAACAAGVAIALRKRVQR